MPAVTGSIIKPVKSTGILVVSSSPNAAKIYLNGKLNNATNTNISIAPGYYDIELKKEGYRVYKKTLSVKGELVTKVDALLFPQNPSLSPVTSLGVMKAFFSNDFSKIILLAAGNDTEPEGIYLLETSTGPISLSKPVKLLAAKSSFGFNFDFNNCQVAFHPNNQEFIFMISDSSQNQIASFLIDTSTTKQQPYNITLSKPSIELAYDLERNKTTNKILETFKNPVQKIATDSFNIIHFSPDDTKILYTAKKDVSLGLAITPPLIATNQTEQNRDLVAGKIYVYDKKEDKNYLINFPEFINATSILWYPDSSHLIYLEKNQISISEYDGGQKTVVYSGPFERDFVSVTDDGKLLILANLNRQVNQYPDVYLVGIK